jgi:uncharacterized repeat protein (TIGR03803 family)
MAASTENILYTFTGNQDSGAPYGGLVADSSGNLYGTASGWFYPYNNSGVVFELTPSGNGQYTFNVIHSFHPYTDPDGINPMAGLTFDSQGNLYGTCEKGGNGYGTVFELSPSGGGNWTLSKVYAFTNQGDGAWPVANVILDSAGNVYGTTEGYWGAGPGNVFELTPSGSGWTEQTLHTFGASGDGSTPEGGLIMDREGNLYGTTYLGGTCGNGVVFKLHNTGSSWVETVLYAFQGGLSDGATPVGNLAFDSVGRIIGTTLYTYSESSGNGGVFRLAPSPTAPRSAEQEWQITWLHEFTGQTDGDGANPSSGVVLDSAGNIYGTTAQGGTNQDDCPLFGCEVVYKLTPAGSGAYFGPLRITERMATPPKQG